MHFLVNHASGYIEEKNWSKYLVFNDSVTENKALLTKYADVWHEIKNEIKAINRGEESKYGKYYMKIKFNSDDGLLLNKPLKLHAMTRIIRFVFEARGKLYPQVFFRWRFVWIIKMPQCKKTDVSEGIDINITNASKECELCHSWYFKDVGFKFEPHVCNKCHDVLMTAYEFKNIATLNVKGVDFWCILWGISRDEAVNRLNNSVLEDRGVLWMDFGANKTPAEIIKEGTFGGTYFRDIYSSVNGKWYKELWKEFNQLKDIDQKFYCSECYDDSVNKYGVKCGTSLRFWENKGWINKTNPYEWFQ